MNSRTSRPRSPTRAITLTSAVVERAIMPSSEDLPTPEPAKMPRRWPRPQGTRVSSARTPRPTRSEMRGRVRASGRRGVGRAGRSRRPGSPNSSSGLPSPSMTRPSRPSPTVTLKGLPVGCTEVPGPMPASSPSGISRVRPPRKPTTSVGQPAGRSRPSPTRQISPISTWRPVASMIRPIRSRTRPRRRARSSSCMHARHPAEGRTREGVRPHPRELRPGGPARRRRSRVPGPAASRWRHRSRPRRCEPARHRDRRGGRTGR